MENSDLMKKRKRRRRRKIRDAVIILGVLAIVLALIIYFVASLIGKAISGRKELSEAKALKAEAVERVLAEAEELSLHFDYDGAQNLLQEHAADFEEFPTLAEAKERYAAEKASLVPFNDIKSVTHVFFHTLIADPALAFDGDYKEAGYNQYMTTIDEFNAILEEMHSRGYILVSLHDLAEMTEGEDGTMRMTPKTLYLPEGKIPFVMSQDDVCYYSYMTGDGFATRLTVGEDGKVTCEYKNTDGSVTTGDYDLVPLLDRFIEKHPDFSYRGAKAVLALTGYDGVLGYRTSPSGEGYRVGYNMKCNT